MYMYVHRDGILQYNTALPRTQMCVLLKGAEITPIERLMFIVVDMFNLL